MSHPIKSKFFSVFELIQPSLLKVLSPQNCLKIIGRWRLRRLDLLRVDYEKEVRRRGLYRSVKDKYLHLNGTLWGKTYRYSGLRSLDCPEGAPKSKHKKGEAFDLKCLHLDVLLYLIRRNWKKYSIKRMENPNKTFHRGWLHIEIGSIGVRLYVFYP